MKAIHRTGPVVGASLLALGLAVGTAGVANAKSIEINGPLTNVNGTVQTGTASSVGPNGAQATLNFSVPGDAFGSDADALGSSSSPVEFSTSLNGTVAGSLATTLNAMKNFSTGIELSDFLLGNSSSVTFDSASISTPLTGTSDVGNPTAFVSNPIFSGDEQTLASLAGGVLNVSGTNAGLLAGLGLDGQLTDGSGSLMAKGDVELGGGNGGDDGNGGDNGNGGDDGNGGDNGNGDDGNGGSVSVPAPSGSAMLLFLGIGAAGMGFARRRQSKGQAGTMAA